ncbi:MAG: GMC family oxidoreductase [Anaerolineae bacterium]
MMQPQQLPPVDAVTIGVGWTASILAKELVDAGLRVVGLERGQYRVTVPDFAHPRIHDELRWAIRGEMFQDLSQDTLTFRNSIDQTALPMRMLGSFLPAEGLGGAGVHWNGATWRFHPYQFTLRSSTVERYGEDAIPEDCTIQDWGITYDELEPYFDKFEYNCGISGKAGNIGGQLQAGGDLFEGPRNREYPTPPLPITYAQDLFRRAADSLGLHPFPMPAANLSQTYTNPYGVSLGQCNFCGYCERFACEWFAKSSPQTTILPLLLNSDRFELRTGARVTNINLDSTGTRAVSVTYVDALGREFEQPAEIILLTAYQLNNVRMLLTSGIGRPYDPATGEGVVGKNYSYQVGGGVTVNYDDQYFNPFIGAGAASTSITDFNDDNFDHTGLGFIGGGYISTGFTGGRPIGYNPTPPGTPQWGSAWKAAVARHYQNTLGIGGSGAVLSYRDNYLDLDPTYRDSLGLPLLRMTFDFHENELRLADFLGSKSAEIARALDPAPTSISVGNRARHYSIVPYQSTHTIGGAIMGSDPATSVVNKYLQSWDVPNLFVVGASAFPQNSAFNPTGTVGALAFWVADAIKTRYLPNPGPLA